MSDLWTRRREMLNTTEDNPYAKIPFTLEIVSGTDLPQIYREASYCSISSITIVKNGTDTIVLDLITNNYFQSSSGTMSVLAGDILEYYAEGNLYDSNSAPNYNSGCYGLNFYGGSVTYNAYGNIMSLVYGYNFIGKKSLTSNNTYSAFGGLFMDNEQLLDASNLFISLETIPPCGLYGMFAGSSVTAAPTTINAKRIEDYGCYYMFYLCTSLLTAPQILATYIGDYACYYMFYSCSKITEFGELPATYIGTRGCDHMFLLCSKLVSVGDIKAETIGDLGCQYMYTSCTQLVNAPKFDIITGGEKCFYNAFRQCTRLTCAAQMSPTTLGVLACYNMYFRCTALTTAYTLTATNIGTGCYLTMFYYCSALEESPILPLETLVTNCYKSMFKYCQSLTKITAYFTTVPSSDYMDSWVSNVSSSGTFYKNPNATWENTYGTSAIPSGWSVTTISS